MHNYPRWLGWSQLFFLAIFLPFTQRGVCPAHLLKDRAANRVSGIKSQYLILAAPILADSQ